MTPHSNRATLLVQLLCLRTSFQNTKYTCRLGHGGFPDHPRVSAISLSTDWSLFSVLLFFWGELNVICMLVSISIASYPACSLSQTHPRDTSCSARKALCQPSHSCTEPGQLYKRPFSFPTPHWSARGCLARQAYPSCSFWTRQHPRHRHVCA